MTVTQLPVTRCQICRRTLACRPGGLSEVLTGHYRPAHPETLGPPYPVAGRGDPQRCTAVLARLGEPEPAAILAGAVSAHFAVTNANVRLDIDEAQILARRALGEAAYRAALGRGAVMEDDEVVGYALGELQRLSDRPMPQ